MQLLDSLVNLVSRLGTSSDKGTHSEYVDEILTAQQIITAYRVSGVVRTIVDRPAREAVRAWREWQATADEISAIELVEKKLGLRIKWRNSIRRARLMGGGAIYIGTGDQNLELPLDPFKMKKGGLQFLTVLSRNQLTAGPMVTDPSLEGSVSLSTSLWPGTPAHRGCTPRGWPSSVDPTSRTRTSRRPWGTGATQC